MTNTKVVLFFLAILIVFSSCAFFSKFSRKNKDTESVTVKNMTEVVFGWGGGFTGMIDEYHLYKNGNVKKGEEFTKKIDEKQMKALLKTLGKVNFNKVKINDPGNLYYFMALKSDKIEHRLTWNDMTELPKEVKAAYDQLVLHTK